MNVLIAADMEGIAGIEDCGECLPAHPAAYARGRELMTGEVLAAVAALRAGAFCSHTFIWEMEVLLDGESLSEVQVYAQALAAEGVPILVAAGDRWMIEDLDKGELGGARLVAAKEGQSRGWARSRDAEEVRAELGEAIAAALSEPPQPPPAHSYPAELRILAEGEELARTTVTEPGELLTAIATVFRSSQVSREYRQLAKLLPAGHDSRLRAAQRRLGSVVATPVMRSKERRWLAASPSP